MSSGYDAADKWAEEARKLAEVAAPELKQAYLRIAGQWQTLGDDIEQDAKRSQG